MQDSRRRSRLLRICLKNSASFRSGVTEVRLKPDSRYQISGNNAESGRIPDTRYLESGIKLTSLFMMGAWSWHYSRYQISQFHTCSNLLTWRNMDLKSDIWNLANAEVSQIPDTRFSISDQIFTKFRQKWSNMCFWCTLSLSWPFFKIWNFFEKSSFFMIFVLDENFEFFFFNISNILLWVDYEFT